MDLGLNYNSEDPIRQWTFRDDSGRNIITNGTNFILNKNSSTIKKILLGLFFSWVTSFLLKL